MEFKELIKHLQEEKLLMNDLEELELEALQGVDGLKVLRVGVCKTDTQIGVLLENELEKTS